jgi:hypothetical protein
MTMTTNKKGTIMKLFISVVVIFAGCSIIQYSSYAGQMPSLEAAHLDTQNTVHIDDEFSCLDKCCTTVLDRAVANSSTILVEESDFVFEKAKADGTYLALPFQEKYRKKIRDHPI